MKGENDQDQMKKTESEGNADNVSKSVAVARELDRAKEYNCTL